MDQSTVPHELRLALNLAARLLSVAFPTALSSLPDLSGDGAGAHHAMASAALAEEEEEMPLNAPTSPTPIVVAAASTAGFMSMSF